jgi:hypothetical protein
MTPIRIVVADPRSGPHDGYAIRLERSVRREDGEPLVQRLHDQDAVKRVGVVQWEVAQQIAVAYRGWQWKKAIL